MFSHVTSHGQFPAARSWLMLPCTGKPPRDGICAVWKPLSVRWLASTSMQPDPLDGQPTVTVAPGAARSRTSLDDVFDESNWIVCAGYVPAATSTTWPGCATR